MTTKTISGSHFKALRMSMGLSHAGCQKLLDINDRTTIRKMETGDSIISCGIAKEMRQFAIDFDGYVMEFLEEAMNRFIVYAEQPEDMDELRYLCQYAIAGHIQMQVDDKFRVIEFDESAYSIFCEANNIKQKEESLELWADSLPEPRTLDSLHKKTILPEQ